MNLRKFLIIILILLSVMPNFPSLALTPSEERQALEAELSELEEQIAQLDEDIQTTEQEKKTLENQIYILRNKIRRLDLQIYQGNVMIEDLSFQIEDTSASIEDTSLKIRDSRDQLANILQLVYEADQKSLIEILLSETELSDFFDDLMALESLNAESQELLNSIEDLKVRLEAEKEALDEEKQELENIVTIQTLQRKESAQVKKDKDWLLSLTEAEYQKYLGEKEETERKAAEIRARIFELIGVPEGGIEFGKAVEIAQYVERVTGVRAAFLLSILAQESMRYGKIGENVGQCYLQNSKTGDGIYIESGKKAPRTMNPKRDISPFFNIIEELNKTKGLARDVFKTPVSCWMPVYYKGSPVGWGGAMGPAQFIPSTWILYENQISKIIGKLADPWEIKDSFLAAGLYLGDLGASSNELKAAMHYFSGSSWTWWEEKYYGKPVIARAEQYQEEIDLLERSK